MDLRHRPSESYNTESMANDDIVTQSFIAATAIPSTTTVDSSGRDSDNGIGGSMSASVSSIQKNQSAFVRDVEAVLRLPIGTPQEEQQTMDAIEAAAVYTTSEFLSNTFFLMGGVLYLWLSIWDLRSDTAKWYLYQQGPDYRYEILSVLAPMMYLVNAIVDLDATIPWTHVIGLPRRRYYAGSNKWEAANALMFGTAATFDLLASLKRRDAVLSYIHGSVAVHMYVINAVMVLLQRKYSSGVQATLVQAGDVLFLFGSLIDVVINYLSYPLAGTPTDAVTSDIFSLLSSVLWLVDALLYNAAPILAHRAAVKARQRRKATQEALDLILPSMN